MIVIGIVLLLVAGRFGVALVRVRTMGRAHRIPCRPIHPTEPSARGLIGVHKYVYVNEISKHDPTGRPRSRS